MKIALSAILNSRMALVALIAFALTAGAVTMRSQAASTTAAVTITNSSAWSVNALYLSASSDDNWGPDQLNGSSIAPGEAYTLNFSWSQPTVKLVAEDQDGCFITTTVEVSSAAAWTITSSSSRNCGSN